MGKAMSSMAEAVVRNWWQCKKCRLFFHFDGDGAGVATCTHCGSVDTEFHGAAPAAPTIQTMTILIESGPGLNSVATTKNADYGENQFTLKSGEPKGEGGNGEGANPMELSIMSLPVCEQEESNMIADGLGFKETWSKVNWKCEFDVNLDGYAGIINDRKLPAKDVFRRVYLSGLADTDLSEADVAKVDAGVLATCPVTGLFKAAGCEIVRTLTKGSAHPDNPEIENRPDMTMRMGVLVQGAGFHSDVTVQDEVKHTYQLAEPVADGGSGKGPNPMEALTMSLAICEFETSCMVVKEMKGSEEQQKDDDWTYPDWAMKTEISNEINLDGYMNVQQNMKASEVFRQMTITSTVQTDLTQEEVDRVAAAVDMRCPLTRLFDDAGAKIVRRWVLA